MNLLMSSVTLILALIGVSMAFESDWMPMAVGCSLVYLKFK